MQCLANNIYFEARGEPLAGKLAVAAVTVNRVGKFASTICGVVYQPGQFSWTRDKRLLSQRKEPKAWAESLSIARKVLAGHGFQHFNAVYFHNTKTRPNWKQKRVAKIGSHIFYAQKL